MTGESIHRVDLSGFRQNRMRDDDSDSKTSVLLFNRICTEIQYVRIDVERAAGVG